MLYNYETKIIKAEHLDDFEKWLNKEIGTEYEINDADGSAKFRRFYAVIFDVLRSEIKDIEEYIDKLK